MIYTGRLFNNLLADKMFGGKKVKDTETAVREIAQKVSPTPAEVKAKDKEEAAKKAIEQTELSILKKKLENAEHNIAKLLERNEEVVNINKKLSANLAAFKKQANRRKSEKSDESEKSDDFGQISENIGQSNGKVNEPVLA